MEGEQLTDRLFAVDDLNAQVEREVIRYWEDKAVVTEAGVAATEVKQSTSNSFIRRCAGIARTTLRSTRIKIPYCESSIFISQLT